MGLLYSCRCALCDKPIEKEQTALLCADCGQALAQNPIRRRLAIDGADEVRAALPYAGAVRGALHRFKFSGKPYLAKFFAAQMLPILNEAIPTWQPDFLTYPPLGLLRYWKRGYNQAELLARALSAQSGLAVQSVLRKRAFVGKQSKQKGAEARAKNAQKAFLPRKIDLQGKSIVLIDDVLTTGQTAGAIAGLLREMGASKVYVLTACCVVGRR